MYSDVARRRKRDVLDEMLQDVAELRIYRALVEEVPHIVLVLSSDIQCRVLFASTAFTRILFVKTDLVLGKTLWELVHDGDKTKFAQYLTAVILGAPVGTIQRTRARIETPYNDCYISLGLTLSAGTQGIHCRMWKHEGAWCTMSGVRVPWHHLA